MVRSLVVASLVLALAGSAPAGSATAAKPKDPFPWHYRVRDLKGEAHMTYSGTLPQRLQGKGDVTFELNFSPGKRQPDGILGLAGGSISPHTTEHLKVVVTWPQPPPAPPGTCDDSQTVEFVGAGVDLEPHGSGVVTVKWFGPAVSVFGCPGPDMDLLLEQLGPKMTRTYPLATLKAKEFTLTLSGEEPFIQPINEFLVYEGTYRWQMTLEVIRCRIAKKGKSKGICLPLLR